MLNTFRTAEEARLFRFKALSLFLLVVQGTGLSLTMRSSRVMEGQPYLGSVAVVCTETLKILFCMGALGYEWHSRAVDNSSTLAVEARAGSHALVTNSLPMAVPAALFVMQQVLEIVAASNLDAVTFLIFAQAFKVIPTALFAVWLLGQHLFPLQWGSLPLLALGVILVTLTGTSPEANVLPERHNLPLGIMARAAGGLSSAFAGVYFEKFVKGRTDSLWVRNLQLSMYGVPLGLLYVALNDGGRVVAGGFFQGFNSVTWAVIFLQVFGGLVCGAVVKYADNILKNFAVAVSVIFTVMGAAVLFGQQPDLRFVLGTGIILGSVFMYAAPPPKRSAKAAAAAPVGAMKAKLSASTDMPQESARQPLLAPVAVSGGAGRVDLRDRTSDSLV